MHLSWRWLKALVLVVIVLIACPALSLSFNGDCREALVTSSHKGIRALDRPMAPTPLGQKFKTDDFVKVIVMHKGKIAMVRRRDDPLDPFGGMWELPGGHAKAYADGTWETAEAAARREVREETQLRIEPIIPAEDEALKILVFPKGDGTFYRVFIIEATLAEGSPREIRPIEDEPQIVEGGWFYPYDLPDGTIPGVEHLLREVQVGVGFWSWFLDAMGRFGQHLNRVAQDGGDINDFRSN